MNQNGNLVDRKATIVKFAALRAEILPRQNFLWDVFALLLTAASVIFSLVWYDEISDYICEVLMKGIGGADVAEAATTIMEISARAAQMS